MATHISILLLLGLTCFLSTIYAETAGARDLRPFRLNTACISWIFWESLDPQEEDLISCNHDYCICKNPIPVLKLFMDNNINVWKELRTKELIQKNAIHLGPPIHPNRIDPSRVTQLSWQPRVFLYHGFLSEEECDHLISLAKGKRDNHVSSGGDLGDLGAGKLDRSSETISTMDDIVASRIEERISSWTFLPKENSKPFKILHFGHEDAKQSYSYFGSESTLDLNEPLMATVVLYLSNVSQGGQILFPKSELKDSTLKSRKWTHCEKAHHALRPTKGNALLFFNSHLNASPDKSSSHTRCPVLEGELWCASKIFHLRRISAEKVSLELEESECTDEDKSCPQWAAIGECERNPVFMIGSPDYYGTCRKSCKAC